MYITVATCKIYDITIMENVYSYKLFIYYLICKSSNIIYNYN